MKRQTLTLFTWGYWGWGTAAHWFVDAADAVETSRGFRPPQFVDIRISRSVRAPGFNGPSFERTLGPSRYQWMPALGNVAILQGGKLQIKNPTAAEDLLDLAEERHGERRRVLFFCACEFPGLENRGGCHRTTVARLVLEAAARRHLKAQIVEWPGGEPLNALKITVSPDAFSRLNRGAKSILLTEPVSLANVASIPWYSFAEIQPSGATNASRGVLTGPAKYDRKSGWWVPRLKDTHLTRPSDALRQRIQKLRSEGGFEPRRTRS